MAKSKVLIRFSSLHQLWRYVEQIRAVNLEINTKSLLLICDCSANDLDLLSAYSGEVVKTFSEISLNVHQ